MILYKNQMIPEKYRIDFVFSFWIFAWFLLYIFGHTTFSPFFVLILGIIHNTSYFIKNMYKKSKVSSQLLFVIGNFVLKIMPALYFVMKKKTKVLFRDVMFTIGLFIVHVIWLKINNQMIFLDLIFKLKSI